MTGTITDPAGAVVPGAHITLVALKSGVPVGNFTSTGSGVYRFANLPEGTYQLDVTANGFAQYSQTGIVVHVSDVVTANVQLEIGTSTQSVQVEGGASTLNFENPTVKTSVPTQAVDELPLQVSGAPRTAANFVSLAPGVTDNNPFSTVINGGLPGGAEGLLDGVTVTEGISSVSGGVSMAADQPITPESVSEVTLLTSNYDAQFGSTTGGVITLVTKSGSEQVHGELHEFLHNNDLNARQFDVPNRPKDIQNEFGFSVGGPVRYTHIPGAWSDKRKTFFFISFDEWIPRGSSTEQILSVPTVQERNGNFSDWVDSSGNLIPLYDPSSTRANPNYNSNLPVSLTNEPYLRTQFAGNIIPTSRLSPIALAFLKYLPTPNLPGTQNNYAAPPVSDLSGLTDHRNAWDMRFDHYEGDKDRFSVILHYHLVVLNSSCVLPAQLCPVGVSKDGNSQGPWMNRASWDHTFSPTLLNTFNAGYNDERGHDECISNPYASTLPQIAGVFSHSQTPVITFENFTAFGCNNSGYASRPVYDYNDMLTEVRGRHTIRLGGDFRALQQNTAGAINTSGTFNFAAESTGQLGIVSGSDMASFLLGQVDSASVTYPTATTSEMRSKQYALFASDTWKLSKKLSIDYGLRWDVATPAVDRYNSLSWFDPSVPNPGAGNLPGSLVFAGSTSKYGSAAAGTDHPEYTYYKALAPRVGLAYELNSNTVLRAGYGIFYTSEAYSGWSGGSGQEGFNLNANFSASNGGITPAFLLSQGVPQNFQQPPFFSLSAGNGQEAPLYRAYDSNRAPYSQQWNLTVEHQIGSNFHASAAYVGNKGTRLPSAIDPLNALNPSLLSLGQKLNDQFQSGQTVLDGVHVPYAGWVDQMTACPPTVAQALLPFPQYCGPIQGNTENLGNSTYHSLQVQAVKRYSHGLWFTASYTWSKMISDSGGPFQPGLSPSAQNLVSPYQQNRDKAVSQFDIPHIFSSGLMYDLPFGKERRYRSQNSFVDQIIGGWQMNTLFKINSGSPLVFYSNYCNVPSQFDATCLPAQIAGVNPFLQSRGSYDPGKGPLLNVNAFENANNFNFYIGQGAPVSNLRGPGYHSQDLSLFKTIPFHEKDSVQFRAEAFNVWNWHLFNTGPGSGFNGGLSPASSAFVTDVSSPNFGQWNGSVSAPRNIQLALKVLF